MKIMCRLFLAMMMLLCSFSYARAEIKLRYFRGFIYVSEATTAETEELFGKYRYKRFRALDDDAVPAIFLDKLPSDFLEISSQKYRNELFIRILVPIALKINQEIINERRRLLRLEEKIAKQGSLAADDVQWLESMAVKYDFFTRLKAGESRIAMQIENLKRRVNVIPPSILVAVAAMESNWGTSRVAHLARSLYKEKVWYTTEGLAPLEDDGDGYRFKIFNTLTESMRSYAVRFNSDISYRTIWSARESTARRQDYLIGESIAYAISRSSNLPNYAGILDYTTAFYDLAEIDRTHLKHVEP